MASLVRGTVHAHCRLQKKKQEPSEIQNAIHSQQLGRLYSSYKKKLNLSSKLLKA